VTITLPRIGSFCSGYRGLDTAVEEVFGGTTAWVSDIDPGANKILAHHWPAVPNIGDLTTTRWEDVEPVDIVCGGYPSAANTPADRFWQRAIPTDDGHMLWPGTCGGRVPRIKCQGVQVPVPVVAFGIANDREPVGRVLGGCEREGCVHPRHVEDDVLRARFATVFGQIFGAVTA
jgi:hypothetical protein